ncbi:hypothetical protein FA15DRAFT_695914 [Coprinopsis marcescibilis]|uniref:TPR-like protein n=1 Tax=Coprinopsis marcescibilis TaxID=230819 RepID=A0A5C3KNT2_COPMA|nr:hypothetical protein FA15DRAFT_695914 [Coprinopsis marcescibilis]
MPKILVSPPDGGQADASTQIEINDNTNITPLSKTKTRRIWESLKGSLGIQGSGKAGIEILSKASNVTLNDVVINAAERMEFHYHGADPGTVRLQEALRRLPDPKRCYWDVMHVCSEGTRIAHLDEISSWATSSVKDNVPPEQAERVLVVGDRLGVESLHWHTRFAEGWTTALTSEDFMAVFIRGLCSISTQIEQRIGRLIVEKPALASSSAIMQFEDYVPRLPSRFKFVLITRPVPEVMQAPREPAPYPSVLPFAARRHRQRGKQPLDGVETPTKKLESLYAHILSKLQWTDRRFVEKYRVVMRALVTLMEPLSVRGLAALYAPDGITEEDIHRIFTFIRPLLQDYSPDTPQKPVRLLHLSVQEFLTQNAPPPYHIDPDDHHMHLSRLSLLTIKEGAHPYKRDWVWDFSEGPQGIPRLSKEMVLEQLCEIADESPRALLYEIVVEKPRYLLEASASMGALVDIVPLRNKVMALHIAVCTMQDIRNTMKAYFAMAACLSAQDKSFDLMEEAIRLYRESWSPRSRLTNLLSNRFGSNEGTKIAEEALAITRRLLTAGQITTSPVVGSALLLQSRFLYKLDRPEESHEMDLKCISTFRELEAAQPGTYSSQLAIALFVAGTNLIFRNRYDEAICYIQESTELRRWLASRNPEKHEDRLAGVLLKYGLCLVQVGRAKETVALGEEAVEIRRRLAEKDASYFSPGLADSLYWLGWYLSECGRYSDAVPHSTESLVIYRKLSETDPPTAHEGSLSDSLHAHAHYLSKSPAALAKSIEAGQEAVEIRRRLLHRELVQDWRSRSTTWPLSCHAGTKRSGSIRSLIVINYALYLSESPPTLAESIESGQEAVEIRRRLANKDSQTFDSGLAQSLFNLASNLCGSGRCNDAIQIAKECWLKEIQQHMNHYCPRPFTTTPSTFPSHPPHLAKSIEPSREAVNIYRRLAREDPERFDAELAQSLFKLAGDLKNCDRFSDALPIAKECINVARRLEERDPAEYESLLAESLHYYASYLSDSPTTLAESIEPGQEAVEIRRRLAREHSQSFESGLAESLFHLASNLYSSGQCSDAIPVAKECVEVRRGLKERDPAAYEPFAGALDNFALYLSESPTTLVESIEHSQEAVNIRRRLAREDPQTFEAGLAQSLHNLASALDSCGRCSDAIQTAKESVDIHHRLAKRDPTEYEAPLSDALHNYACFLSQSPTTLAESIEHGQEAVEIRRRMAREDPQNFSAALARSLTILLSGLVHCSRYGEAVLISEENVDIHRRLAEHDRSTVEPSLADTLNSHAWSLMQNPGREHEALKPAEESVNMYRQLALEDPQQFSQGLVMSLDTMADCLNHCGRYEDALPFCLEGLSTCRQAIGEVEDQDFHDRNSGALHRTYANSLVGLGYNDEAIAVLNDANTIYQRLVTMGPEDPSYSLQLEECGQLLKRLLGGSIDSK